MAKTWRNYKDESRKNNIGENVEEGYRPCDDQTKLGAILRIADAAEKMALSYDDLRKERDYLKDKIEMFKDDIAFYEKRIAGLKGYLKRLKNG